MHSNLIYLNYLFQVCNVFLDSFSCIFEGKQKPLIEATLANSNKDSMTRYWFGSRLFVGLCESETVLNNSTNSNSPNLRIHKIEVKSTY